MIGHLLDATESYLAGFDIARHGGAAPEPVGVAGMAKAPDVAARAFRSVPRDELLARLRDTTDQLIKEFESMSDADWSGLDHSGSLHGPAPGDDHRRRNARRIRRARLGRPRRHGAPHAIAGDAADLLVPFVFLLWWATADTVIGRCAVRDRYPHHRSQRRRHPIRRHSRRASSSRRPTSTTAPRSSSSTPRRSCSPPTTGSTAAPSAATDSSRPIPLAVRLNLTNHGHTSRTRRPGAEVSQYHANQARKPRPSRAVRPRSPSLAAGDRYRRSRTPRSQAYRGTPVTWS